MIAVCAFASWGAFLFMMSLYLQGQRGFSALHTGLIYLPVAGGALIFSPLSGRLVGRFGSRPSLFVAGTLITAATLMLTRLTAGTPVWQLLLIFAVFGIGFSMVNAPITTAAVSGMPTDRAGAASAVASTSRQVGVSLGVALCGSLAGAAIASTGADFAVAARPLWYVCAALGVIIFVLGAFATSARATRSAERLAPLIDQSQGRVSMSDNAPRTRGAENAPRTRAETQRTRGRTHAHARAEARTRGAKLSWPTRLAHDGLAGERQP